MVERERYVVISSDGHVGASIDAYRPYLESRWHDEFDEWSATFTDPWAEVEQTDVTFGVASLDSRFSWDSELRQRAVESEGIVGEVLFPNTAPPFFPSGVVTADAPRTADEYKRRFAGLRAHNRWLADFCSLVPGRRAGIGQIFLNDIDDAVAEVRAIGELGLSGVLLPGDGATVVVPLYSAELDPLWAACAELDLPVHRHSNLPGLANSSVHGPAGPAVGMMESMFFLHRGLSHVTFAGAFERFPGLKYVTTEGGTGWVPDFLAEMDMIHSASKIEGSIISFFSAAAMSRLPRTPSEYFSTNGFVGASLLRGSEVAARHQIGVDNIMWGSDFPHQEGPYPYSRLALRAAFAGVPRDEVRRMLSENAAAVYGFDLEVLRPVADRIGPFAEDVERPLELHEYPRYPAETVSPPLVPDTGGSVVAGNHARLRAGVAVGTVD